MSEANQVVPTPNGDLSGLYSTGASAASEDVTPGCAYKVTIDEAMHMLRRALPWLKTPGYSVVLASTTQTLGGFPVTTYLSPSFFMRAVQDQLTTELH